MGTTDVTSTPDSEMLNGVTPSPAMGTQGTGEMSGPTTTTPSLDDALKELDTLRAALKKANTDATTHRHKANELDKLQAAQMTDTEKREQAYQELQTRYDQTVKAKQQEAVGYEVRLQALSMGIGDPDAAAALLHMVGDIEYDETTHKPTNVKALLKKLLEAKPYLRTTGGKTAISDATNPSRSVSGNNGAMTWEEYARLTPEQYATRRQEVQKFLADNRRRGF